jgi:uncharacterized protein (TIGR00297 family)
VFALLSRMTALQMTTQDLLRLLIVAVGIVLLLVLSEGIRRTFLLANEFSRKLVHIGTGVFVLFAPLWFTNAAPILLIATMFTVLNLVAYKLHWLRSVHHTPRMSYGTVYYPLSLLILAFLLWEKQPAIVVASIFTLALGDGAAGAIGESVRHPFEFRITSDTKSIQGSTAMFGGTLAALVLTNFLYPHTLIFDFQESLWIKFLVFLAIGIFLTGWEAASSRGLDNLTVPLFAALALVICSSTPSGFAAIQFSTGVFLGAGIGFLSYKTKLLQPSGAIGTMLLASVIYGFGGWKWTLPIFSFFVLSSFLSKWGKVHKKSYEHVFEKSDTRDIWQVAANGGISGILILLWRIFPSDIWYTLFLGSVAAVTADTWATELGVLSRKEPVLITTLKRVSKGTSGGISLAGTLSGMLGSLIVALTSIPFLQSGAARIVSIAVISGVIGNLTDSVLGATIQAQYRCRECGSYTEKTIHCLNPSVHIRGYVCMNNDTVNVLCAFAGALSAFVLSVLVSNFPLL